MPPTPETAQLAAGLQIVLSNTVGFYFAAHRAHWNVVGPDFSEYHALFAEIYGDTYSSIDPLAENIRKLRAFPTSLPDMVRQSQIQDDFNQRTADALAGDLLAKNQMLISMLKELFDVATAANEQGIANFIAERIDSHEKWDWQLSASLGV